MKRTAHLTWIAAALLLAGAASAQDFQAGVAAAKRGDFEVARAASVTGVVKTPSGDPVGGASITKVLVEFYDRGGAYMTSVLVYDSLLYRLRWNGNLACFEARTGELVYQEMTAADIPGEGLPGSDGGRVSCWQNLASQNQISNKIHFYFQKFHLLKV